MVQKLLTYRKNIVHAHPQVQLRKVPFHHHHLVNEKVSKENVLNASLTIYLICTHTHTQIENGEKHYFFETAKKYF